MSKYDDLSEEELMKKLDQGFKGERELAEMLSAMQAKGMSGGLIGFEKGTSEEEKVVIEYIDFHQKLENDTPTARQMRKAIKILERKRRDVDTIKKAILTLAHSGKVKSLRALEKYSKKAKGELLIWAKVATSECRMFLESKLSDNPKIQIEKISDDSDDKSSTSAKISRLLDFLFSDKDEAKRAIEEYFDGKVGPNGEIIFESEEDEGLLMDWLVFDYRCSNGNKLIENFINANKKLGKKELAAFEELQYNKFGYFEIKEVKKDQWVLLESLQSGKQYKIIEKLGTHSSKPGMILICRVGKENGKWRMIGSNPLAAPFKFSASFKEMLRGSSNVITPKDCRKLISG